MASGDETGDETGAAPGLACPDAPSSTGAYRLSWTHVDVPVETWTVREDGVVLYRGADRATTVTGRPEGEYAYTLRAEVDGGEAAFGACTVVVDPPSLTSAFSLFGAGLLVFAATVVVVLLGHRAHRRGEIG